MTDSAGNSRRAAPSQVFGRPHPQAWVEAQEAQKARENEKRSQEVQEFLQEIEEKYRHLPALPPPLPSPTYSAEEASLARAGGDEPLAKLYAACADGRLPEVQDLLSHSELPLSHLELGLEEASHNFHLDVVEALLKQKKVQLHYRCFRRSQSHQQDLSSDSHSSSDQDPVQSIFTSNHEDLIHLLNIFHEHGWHPNQLLGPLLKPRGSESQSSLQEVALHYPRCLRDTEVLKFLLKAGADPTIAREKSRHNILKPTEVPTQRLSGHILEDALNTASPESVDLLLSYNAEPEQDWAPLQSLARRYDANGARLMTPDEEAIKDTELPDSPYPDKLSDRLTMAKYLLDKGFNVNEKKTIFHIVERHNTFGQATYAATPLFHASAYMDWELVKWLLENGAEPPDEPVPMAKRDRRTYALDVDVEEHRQAFDEVLESVRDEKKKDR